MHTAQVPQSRLQTRTHCCPHSLSHTHQEAAMPNQFEVYTHSTCATARQPTHSHRRPHSLSHFYLRAVVLIQFKAYAHSTRTTVKATNSLYLRLLYSSSLTHMHTAQGPQSRQMHNQDICTQHNNHSQDNQLNLPEGCRTRPV